MALITAPPATVNNTKAPVITATIRPHVTARPVTRNNCSRCGAAADRKIARQWYCRECSLDLPDVFEWVKGVVWFAEVHFNNRVPEDWVKEFSKTD